MEGRVRRSVAAWCQRLRSGRWNAGIRGGTVGLWGGTPGLVGLWACGFMGLWDSGIAEPWNHGTRYSVGGPWPAGGQGRQARDGQWVDHTLEADDKEQG